MLLLFSTATAVHADSIPLANGCGSASRSATGPSYIDVGGQKCVPAMSPIATYQGTMSVTAATRVLAGDFFTTSDAQLKSEISDISAQAGYAWVIRGCRVATGGASLLVTPLASWLAIVGQTA